MTLLVILAAVGLITGLLAGLLGIGGGLIAVPALFYLLGYFQFPQEELMHLSIATALAATALTSCGSTWAHHRKKALSLSTLKFIIPGLLLGCGGGVFLTHILSGGILKDIFGSMLIVLGIYFFFPHLPHFHFGKEPNWTLIGWGVGVGCLSSLLGIGGGLFMVPIFFGYALSVQKSVATSAAGTLATALIGTTFYLFAGWHRVPSPALIGYIYIPGFLTIGLSSLLTTHWGAHLAHTLPIPLLKRIFACLLMITGVTMLVGNHIA